jgi:hypothetical protein
MICVELFGVPRQRAGCSVVELVCGDDGMNLAQALHELSTRLPDLAAECFPDGQLHPAYTANLDGETFLRNADSQIMPGQHLLIMSTDAGG